jgi:tRNA (guanine-N7-)-methyltransferase
MAASHGRDSTSSTRCGSGSEGALSGERQSRRVLFGRRRGRPLRAGKRLLKEKLLPHIAVTLPTCGGVDPQALFAGAGRPIWLEIGFGGGEHLIVQAGRHLEVGLIGCEVFENGIAKLLAGIERQHLDNLRIFTDDARLLIARLPPRSIERVFILFPDPWPKRRHWKRRIIVRETLDRLAMIMTDGAELRLATDDRSYLASMLHQLTTHPDFRWLALRPSDWRERAADWPATRYEEKARAAGRVPVFLRAIRRPRAG